MMSYFPLTTALPILVNPPPLRQELEVSYPFLWVVGYFTASAFPCLLVVEVGLCWFFVLFNAIADAAAHAAAHAAAAADATTDATADATTDATANAAADAAAAATQPLQSTSPLPRCLVAKKTTNTTTKTSLSRAPHIKYL